MPKKKEPPRTREEQDRAFKEMARARGADESGKAFEVAMKKIAAGSRSSIKRKPHA
jgi:hypothetical protein